MSSLRAFKGDVHQVNYQHTGYQIFKYNLCTSSFAINFTYSPYLCHRKSIKTCITNECKTTILLDDVWLIGFLHCGMQ